MAKQDQSWRESYSGASLRKIVLELQGEKDMRQFQCWRIWEKPEGKIGFQLTNVGPSMNKWLWFPVSKVLSFSVEPVEGAMEAAHG